MKIQLPRPGTKWKDRIKLDPWDTWNLDVTLAKLIHPLLIQLRDTSHGFFIVADEDAPESMSSENAPPYEKAWEIDDNAEKRYEYVMKEMIFAFDMIANFNDAFDLYKEGWVEHQERIDRGTRLFGKYFRHLWD